MEEAYSETNAGLHYDLFLDLDPRRNLIAVTGSLAYHSPQNRLERARFYLNRQFVINRISGRRVLGHQFEILPPPDQQTIPQAGILDVFFNPPLRKRETTLIQFEYRGTITEWPTGSANLMTTDWVELGKQLPWYPIQAVGAQEDLTFTLKVTCPAGYQVSSYGGSDLQGNTWFFNWPYPTTDIVVTAGTSLETRTFESEANRAHVASATFTDTAVDQLGGDLLWILERFSGWFGPTRPTDFTLIESPRSEGESYSRRGLVVLNGINELEYLGQREAYLRYLAHEAAHVWWWEAPNHTWEDWLNESFAEYSALLAIRERFGQETYERFLDRKRERVQQAVPSANFERADTSTQEKRAAAERILYDQGPLLLHELAERLGYSRFLELCRARLWSGVTTTAHLLDLLGELEGPETQRWMSEKLASSPFAHST